MHKSKKAVILDFDGTIADSFTVFLEALQATLQHAHPFNPGDVEKFRASSTREIIQKLNIKPWQLPMVILRGRREIDSRMGRVTVFEGIPEALRQLTLGYSLYILSTNSSENIEKFLKKYELTQHITGIYGSSTLTGKARSLAKVVKKEGLELTQCVYVGDEVRDIEASRQAGMFCVAVQWGYNSPDILQKSQPDAMAAAPKDLPGVIEALL